MPQDLRVVRCYKCETFQVDIEKLSNKWKCKICGEKQSLKKVYFAGFGKECRKVVQELNLLRLNCDNSLNEKLDQMLNLRQNVEQTPKVSTEINISNPSSSKWLEFVDKVIEASSDEDETNPKLSPPRKKTKYSTKPSASARHNDIHKRKLEKKKVYTNTEVNKKACKRPLLSLETETNNPSMIKYSKIINTRGFIDKVPNNPTSNINCTTNKLGKSKWSQYIDEEIYCETEVLQKKTCNSALLEQDLPKIMKFGSAGNLTNEESGSKAEVTNPPTSVMPNAENFNWNIHTEWDSFSEPSQTSHNEEELSDIVDDQFEEFECKSNKTETHSGTRTHPVGIFNTVENNSDLDSILTL